MVLGTSSRRDFFAREGRTQQAYDTINCSTIKKPTKVSADGSTFGLWGVLLQKAKSEWKQVVYVSSLMTEIKRRCAQIEKEVLAITWVCEKFSDYIPGK